MFCTYRWCAVVSVHSKACSVPRPYRTLFSKACTICTCIMPIAEPKVKHTPSNVCSFTGQAVPTVHRLPVGSYLLFMSLSRQRTQGLRQMRCYVTMLSISGICLGFLSRGQVMVLSNLAKNTELAHLKLQAAWSSFSNRFFRNWVNSATKRVSMLRCPTCNRRFTANFLSPMHVLLAAGPVSRACNILIGPCYSAHRKIPRIINTEFFSPHH
jgi:hypothetical protein